MTQNGRGRAVALSCEVFKAMQAEAALLTRLARAEGDRQAGRARPQGEVLAEARGRLARRMSRTPPARVGA